MINFKVKLGLINYNNIDKSSIINCPITIKGKCIGVIIDYNIDTDEASGFLIDNLSFNLNQDKSINSVEIIQDKSILWK